MYSYLGDYTITLQTESVIVFCVICVISNCIFTRKKQDFIIYTRSKFRVLQYWIKYLEVGTNIEFKFMYIISIVLIRTTKFWSLCIYTQSVRITLLYGYKLYECSVFTNTLHIHNVYCKNELFPLKEISEFVSVFGTYIIRIYNIQFLSSKFWSKENLKI